MPNPTKSSLQIVREAAKRISGIPRGEKAVIYDAQAFARLVLAWTEPIYGQHERDFVPTRLFSDGIDRCAREIQESQ